MRILFVKKEESALNRAVTLSGLIPLLLGIFAILGWLSGIRTLASVKPEYIPMAPDTAIIFVILSIIFLFGFSNHKNILKYLNTFIISFITVYGLLKFIGYLIDINLTFDNTLFPSSEKLGIYPFRHMSPLTGSSFFITGIAILIKIYGKDKLKMLNFLGLLGIAILFNGFTAVLGYIFGNPLLYGSATIPIALTTSVSFCFIGLGITAMSGSNSIFLRHFIGNSPSARMLRIILPIIVFAVLGDNIIYNFLSQEFEISLASLVSVITLILIIITSISVVKISHIIFRNAKIEEEKRKAAEIALQEANEMLEQRVYERTEALQTSEERLRGIFRSSPDGFVVIDTKGNITDCNERLLEIFNNKSKGKLLGKNAFSFIVEEDRKRADENWKTVFDEGIHNDTEYTLITSDGRKFPANVSTSLMKNATGKILGLVIVVRDITERKKAEEKIKESEEKFSTLYSSMTEGVAIHKIIYDNSGIPVDYLIMDVNPAYEKITGLEIENTIGKKASKLYGTDEPPYFEIYKNVAITGIPESFETYFEPMDKHFRISVFSPGQGKFATVFDDITSRRKVEEALRESEERFRVIAASTPDHVLVQDKNLRYTMVINPQLGLSEKDMLNKTDYDFLPVEEADKLTNIKRQVFETGNPVHIEMPLTSGTGELEYFDGSYIPKFDSKGNIDGLIGYFKNMTEHKRMEESLRKIESERKFAEAIQIERQRFNELLNKLPSYVALLSHDYKIPFANRVFEERFGKSNGKLCYECLFDRNEPCEKCETFTVVKTNAPHNWEWTGPDNKIYDVYDYPFTDADGSPLIMEVGIDITDRRKAEKWLMRSNRALRTISACNQVQIHSTSEEELLRNVCKVIVEEGGYKMAWVGYAENDEEKTVRPVSNYGFEDGYLESINITWADTERGRGPTGTAIRTGKPSSCRNMLDDPNFTPWREDAIRHGYSSSLVVPLISEGKTFGAISIYSVEPNAFDSEEENLLKELADDLTYGIMAIRDRIERQSAAETIRLQAERYMAILATSSDGFWRVDIDGKLLDVNDSYCRMSGYSRDELLQSHVSDLEAKEKSEDVAIHIRRIIENKFDRFESKHQKKNGEIIDVEISVAYWNTAEQFLLFVRDITEQKKIHEAFEESKRELIHLASFPKMNPNPIMEINLSKQITFINTILVNLIKELGFNDAGFFIPEDINEIISRLKEDTSKSIKRELIINERYFEQLICSAPGFESIRIYGREITEYRHAEFMIKKSEADLKEAQRLARIGNWSWELETGKLKWSDELYNITGRDKNKKPPSFEETRNYYTPESLNIRNEAVKKSMELGVNTSYDSEMIRVDNNKHIWVQTIIKVEKNDSGKVTKLFGTAQDITERKEAESRANEAYRLYRLIFENSDEGILLSAPDGRIFDANPAATRILGFERDEMIKIGRNEIVDTSDPNLKKIIENRSLNGYATGELTFINKNGGKLHCDISTRIFYNDNGEVFTNIIFHDITERKQIQEALKKSEKELRTLFEILPVGVSIVDIKRNITSSNPALEKIFDITLQDFKSGKHINRKYFKSDLTLMTDNELPNMRAIIEQKPINNVEMGTVKENGELIWTSINAAPLTESSAVTVTVDITERKKAEEKLKKLNEEILDLYNNAPCGYHSVDMNGYFNRINDTELKWIGYERDEIIGKMKLSDLLTPLSQQKFYENFAEFKKKGYIFNIEYEIIKKDGSTFVVNVNATAVYDEAGNYLYSRSSMFDITFRKIAEEKLRQAETNWKETFNAISDRICLLERDGTIIQCNESMLKNIGATEEIIKGRKCFELMHNTKTFLDDCPYSKMMKSKKREISELKLDDKYYSVSVDPILGASGEIVGAVHIIRDITDRKIAEEQMRELAHHIQVIREEERTTLSRTLHDNFGQSLTGMKMEISSIEKKLSKLIDLKSNAEIPEKIKSMKSMIDELAMVTSKMSMELRPNVLDMLGLLPAIEWVVEDFKSKSGINCVLNSKLDKIDIISEHSTEVFRIIQEALTNIVRHANASLVNINILKKHGNIIIEIIDDGKGIKKSDISSPYAFGLLGMNERSSLFGGKIEISGETDKGTKLILYIPEKKNPEFKILNDKNN